MATFTQAQGTRTSQITLGTLAAGTYIASAAIDLGASIPLDVTVEVEFTPSSAPSGNKQMLLFASFSLDNTNYSSGPTSGTTATDEPDLHYIGAVPANSTNLHRKMFSMAGLPVARYMKLVARNDMGVALTSGTVYTAAITGSGV